MVEERERRGGEGGVRGGGGVIGGGDVGAGYLGGVV
jgi:hypothetical protein